MWLHDCYALDEGLSLSDFHTLQENFVTAQPTIKRKGAIANPRITLVPWYREQRVGRKACGQSTIGDGHGKTHAYGGSLFITAKDEETAKSLPVSDHWKP